MAQAVELLTSKYEILSSKPSPTKKRKLSMCLLENIEKLKTEKQKTKITLLGISVHSHNLSTQEAEAGGW
jgi:hypothetical protein